MPQAVPPILRAATSPSLPTALRPLSVSRPACSVCSPSSVSPSPNPGQTWTPLASLSGFLVFIFLHYRTFYDIKRLYSYSLWVLLPPMSRTYTILGSLPMDTLVVKIDRWCLCIIRCVQQLVTHCNGYTVYICRYALDLARALVRCAASLSVMGVAT